MALPPQKCFFSESIAPLPPDGNEKKLLLAESGKSQEPILGQMKPEIRQGAMTRCY
jgi:hypothetical protein